MRVLLTVFCILLPLGAFGANDTYYVNATSLNVREKPDLNSDVVMQLPNGSFIIASKTNITTVYEGKSYAWYEINKGIKGYVLEKFLVKNMNDVKDEPMILYKAPTGYEYSGKFELKLFKGRAILTTFAEFYEPYYEISIGKYVCAGDKIIITYRDSYIEDQAREGQEPVKGKIKSIDETEVIVWNKLVSGFINKEDLHCLNDSKFVLDLDRCYFKNVKDRDDTESYFCPGFYTTRLKIQYKYTYSKYGLEFINSKLK